MDLSVIIPCYNEDSRGNFADRLGRVSNFLNGSGLSYEVILVNDGSIDNTQRTITNACHVLKNFNSICLSENKGKGYAIRRGIKDSHGDYILYMDADLSTPLHYIEDFYYNDYKDCIIGNRVSGKIVENRSLIRKLTSFLSRFCTKLLLGLDIEDTQCGFKMIKADLLRGIEFRSDKWLLDVELLMYLKKNGIKIEEYPVKWGSDLDSTLSTRKALIESFKELIRLMRYR